MYKHPNRRRSKDNPYELEIINNRYLIKFFDSRKNIQVVEVSTEVYEEFNRFELEDIKQMHQYERHIEHREVYEEKLYHREFHKMANLETIVFDKITIDYLYTVINSLSHIQKLRVKKYYFEKMTLKEIAKLEGTTHQAISKSMKVSIAKIKKIMKV